MSQLTLNLDLIKVHCCFCAHTVEHTDPDSTHDAMEAHYATAHVALIDGITRELG